MGRVRIIGGIHRSRLLNVLDADGLRPTLDRVKETLFNWLGQDLTGLKCLDLYCGSGSLAFEALSRNAKHVVMVEKNSLAYQQLQVNQQLLRIENCTLYNQDALQFLAVNQDEFDIIFIDPPYDSDLLTKTLEHLKVNNKLTARGLIYIEYRNNVNLDGFEIIKHKQAGAVKFLLIKRSI